MLYKRAAQERGHANHGWLDSYHTFSFANYYDPEHMGFSALRVINEDHIEGGKGFPTHPHSDMEIITYVIDGALQHKDTMGNTTVIRAGEIQRMSAGTGVRHSEFNPLKDLPTHLYQIWLLPDRKGYDPSYAQKFFDLEFSKKNLVLIASKEGRENSISIHQDADVYLGKPKEDERIELNVESHRNIWIQIVRGDLVINGESVSKSDGLGIINEPVVQIYARTSAEFILFNLP